MVAFAPLGRYQADVNKKATLGAKREIIYRQFLVKLFSREVATIWAGNFRVSKKEDKGDPTYLPFPRSPIHRISLGLHPRASFDSNYSHYRSCFPAETYETQKSADRVGT